MADYTLNDLRRTLAFVGRTMEQLADEMGTSRQQVENAFTCRDGKPVRQRNMDEARRIAEKWKRIRIAEAVAEIRADMDMVGSGGTVELVDCPEMQMPVIINGEYAGMWDFASHRLIEGGL